MASQTQTYCVAMNTILWAKAQRVMWFGLLQEQQVTFKDPLVIWGGFGRAGNGSWHSGTKTWIELLKRDNVNNPEQNEPLF